LTSISSDLNVAIHKYWWNYHVWILGVVVHCRFCSKLAEFCASSHRKSVCSHARYASLEFQRGPGNICALWSY
jgi:hypothetical protein